MRHYYVRNCAICGKEVRRLTFRKLPENRTTCGYKCSAQLRVRNRPSNEDRFWDKVDKRGDDECWNWKGAVKNNGRGLFTIYRKNYIASRMAWIFTNGEVPNGLFVCHTCDNGLCCNPNHMYLGTPKDNTSDMMERGRKVTLRGEDDPKHKLTEEQVREIRAKWKPYEYSQFRLAKEYGVTRAAIQAVINRRTWENVD